MNYFVKSPLWLRVIYPKLTWKIPTNEKVVYLTFDDGPTPEITDWTLDELQKYKARATFFLIGKNIAENPETFTRLKESGHSLGNHTYNHINGWRSSKKEYLQSVVQCDELLQTSLFRPPYGKIKMSQSLRILQTHRIIMWDVLAADFDPSLSGEKCFEIVRKNVYPGSIIVFHDSMKAWPRLKVALPKTLEYLAAEGYKMEAL